MRRSDVPDGLIGRPFTLAEAKASGLTRKVLRGKRFSSTGRGTYVHDPSPGLIEYEGDQHRNDKRQWNRDIDRYEYFASAGYLVVRITAARARYPNLVVRLVHEALCAGGYRGPEPVLDQRWMRLFSK